MLTTTAKSIPTPLLWRPPPTKLRKLNVSKNVKNQPIQKLNVSKTARKSALIHVKKRPPSIQQRKKYMTSKNSSRLSTELTARNWNDSTTPTYLPKSNPTPISRPKEENSTLPLMKPLWKYSLEEMKLSTH